jgi:pyruvate dehydrogenase (quinone)
MLMGEFATAVQYNLPVKVIIIKNNSLGMIRWEQIAFLGNPEFGVELPSIDFVKFAEACGGKGYAIRESNEVKSVMHKAMSERNKPAIIEAYVDPFEPPMPPKVHARFVRNIAESFVKGEAYAKEIGTTLYNDKVHEVLKRLPSKTELLSAVRSHTEYS